ncbi:hypothetical protein SY88_16525 [Clostridiales bacterium PH28_bin88]|nr:hypothetical protein SY88_16525 [Clostridiales bacterium PH28_bin88]
MKLRVVVVDDEDLMREELRYLLSGFKDVEVVGEAASARGALALISRLQPDVMFLDIQMPGQNGLDMGVMLTELKVSPLIVFATAYDEYALEAFGTNAVDYLLKPITVERLEACLAKIRGLLARGDRSGFGPAGPEQFARTGQAKGGLSKIPVNKLGKIVLLGTESLVSASTRNGLVYIRTPQHEYSVNLTFEKLVERLGNTGGFFRCHRNYVVNLDHVREVIPGPNGTYKLVVNDEKRTALPVSRSRAKVLRELLGL